MGERPEDSEARVSGLQGTSIYKDLNSFADTSTKVGITGNTQIPERERGKLDNR